MLLSLALVLVGATVKAQQQQGQPSPSSDQTTAAPQTPPTRVRVSSGVSTRLLRKRTAPEYPPKARSEHIQGIVMMNAVISKEGDVTELTVTSGDPLLADAAVKAVRKWKYKPYLLDGKPVEIETTVQVNFTLAN